MMKGTNPNKVKKDIQQDLNNTQATNSTFGAQATNQVANQATNTLSQFGTDAQQVRNEIQQDLGQGQATNSLFQGTNPQKVKKDIQQDLS